MEEGLTVLVVDSDEHGRTALLSALRRLGLRALGVVSVADAAALLAALDADVVVVRGDEDSPEMALLGAHARVVVLAAGVALEEAVVQLLRELGRPEEAALIN